MHWSGMIKLLAAIATPLLAACSSVAEPPPTVPPPPPCPVMTSSDWRAWVNAMPGPGGGRPALIVVGKVTLPSADWTARFVDSRVMESYPVQVVVELDATSSGLGAQVPVIREVRASWPSEEKVGAVTVVCRGITLARISPVETAH